ncbi:class I SAM-dependent methyltransferase [Flocculibacter collagenilyticus]|uniref:class I SAM-dependent methyltransferase n=1 Tax=Flocculibacter collagenilyticus TaxID=2744479 RepID=UPI0018F47538|nr:class I SAM-dependent methyltransferase [Flocculibacter collagenilyticus]
MNKKLRIPTCLAAVLGLATLSHTVSAQFVTPTSPVSQSLTAVLANAADGDHRSDKQKARNKYRHPAETLAFFDIKPGQTVVEISPGGGWYTSVIAPALGKEGKLYAAHFLINDDTRPYFKKSRKSFEDKVNTKPEYGNVVMTDFHPTNAHNIAPAGSADAVLTFRNVHNWYMRHGDEGLLASFKAFNKALKPGGTLGVVEHRLPEDRSVEDQQKSGYMKESYIIDIAKKAGFKLAAKSEINANPKDTADHPKGVWTLPPRLMLEDTDKEKYLAIGESDRMTLKFVKTQ